ncbi:hypothetical protein Ami103574_10195 [Aminipila butyrica]|uniref:Uncharacterized protein n=1 Tax=Aminipila butyrica TaxID=433296 RepID=A0A858BWW4_9FIRM|nr:hypothetical protein [Aminipila butyrica]QIB69669.1 hypothetical protein Ami103574_10195 [Aminipila butyrica]
MSAFLGKIHFWLYDKVLLHETLIDAIAKAATAKGYSCEDLLAASQEKYGEPVTGSLEDQINHSNIHGWLQERIYSVEKRLAFIVTELLKNEAITIEEISAIFYQNGVLAAKELELGEYTPQDLYTLIFDHMLEGMPCDHVHEIIANTEDAFSWKTTRCLHKEHWQQSGGEVNNFYNFRDSWIQGFLSVMATDYSYARASDGMNTIRRV